MGTSDTHILLAHPEIWICWEIKQNPRQPQTNLTLNHLLVDNYVSQSGLFCSLRTLNLRNARLSHVSIESNFAVGCFCVDVRASEFAAWFKGGIIDESETCVGSGYFSDVVFTNLTDTRVFYVDDPTSSLKIVRCRFDSVITSIYAPIAVFRCSVGYIDRSCFHFCTGAEDCGVSFAFSSHSNEYVLDVSVNSTSEHCCGVGRPQWNSFAGGIRAFSYFHNNHTKTKVSTNRSGMCLTKYPAGTEAACFCRSTEGEGEGIFSMWAYQTGEMLASYFDIINHTVLGNAGLLELHYNFQAKLMGFNFVLSSKRNWESSLCDGSNSSHWPIALLSETTRLHRAGSERRVWLTQEWSSWTESSSRGNRSVQSIGNKIQALLPSSFTL